MYLLLGRVKQLIYYGDPVPEDSWIIDYNSDWKIKKGLDPGSGSTTVRLAGQAHFGGSYGSRDDYEQQSFAPGSTILLVAAIFVFNVTSTLANYVSIVNYIFIVSQNRLCSSNSDNNKNGLKQSCNACGMELCTVQYRVGPSFSY